MFDRATCLGLSFGCLFAVGCTPGYNGSAVLSATKTEARAEDDAGRLMPMSCTGLEFIDYRSARPVMLWLENKSGAPIRASFELEKVALLKGGKRAPAVGIRWEVYKMSGDGTAAPGTTVARVNDCEMEVPKQGAGLIVYFNDDATGGEVEFYDLRAKVTTPKE